MPHFITPGVGETLGPPDPVAMRWKRRIGGWRARARANGDPQAITEEATADGIVPMPVLDQMRLQWTLIQAGLAAVAGTEP